MTDSLLVSIRKGLIEERPLTELLRACIFLGSDTNSDSLQEWAKNELNGYGSIDGIPEYRKLKGPPVFAKIQAGNSIMSNMVLGPHNVPERARKYFPEELHFDQPIQTLIEWSTRQDGINLSPPNLLRVRDLHNDQYAPLNQILNLNVYLDNSYFSGIVDRIRTLMTSMIADLTHATPLDELPSSEKVNATVMKHIENNYETTITQANGAVVIGNSAKAVQKGLSVDDLLKIMQTINPEKFDLGEARAEAEESIQSIADELKKESPNKGFIQNAFEKLKELSIKAGDKAFTTMLNLVGKQIIENIPQLVSGG